MQLCFLGSRLEPRGLDFSVVGLLTELFLGWRRQWFRMDRGRDLKLGRGRRVWRWAEAILS